ncbi:MAG: Hsp33 family molecular chaperone HslO, partial [Clostridia bacterium]|nr:Hsp33 family molecular chaperone HslO [Clostridia bacterium]
MEKQSSILRAISVDGSAFIHAIDATALVTKAREIHNTSKTMTAVLGRALIACSLMSVQLKGEKNTLTLQIQGDGPAGTVLCVGDSKGNVKGYAQNPDVELPPNDLGKLNVGGAIGSGTLHVIKDLGMNEPYHGMCTLVTGEIGEDITEYYATSEQIPSACALGVRVNRDLSVKSAGGFLLQLLPNADPDIVTKLEENLENIGSVSQKIADGMTPLQLVEQVFADIPFDILDGNEVKYSCGCSRKKYSRILATLNQKDLKSLIEEDKPVETVCTFCNTK